MKRADPPLMFDERVRIRLQQAARTAAETTEARHAAVITAGSGASSTRVVCASEDPAVVAATMDALRRHHYLDQGSGSPAAPVDAPRSARPPTAGVRTRTVTRSMALPLETEDGSYGTIVVMDPTGAEFTPQHHSLVLSLAESVAAGLERATAAEEIQRHVDWLDASARVSQQVLRSSSGVMATVQEIGGHVMRLSDARSLTIVVTSPDDLEMLEVRVAAGAGASQLLGRLYPKARSLAGEVMHRGRPQLNPDNQRFAHDVAGEGAHPVLAVPVYGADGLPRGAMIVHRRPEQPPFDRTDLSMVEDFARQTSLALELAETRLVHEKLEHRRKHDRSMRTSNDDLVQSLFAIGMTIQTAQVDLRGGDPVTAIRRADSRLSRAVDDLNEGIAKLRTALEAPQVRH